jgi:hypothetical protein
MFDDKSGPRYLYCSTTLVMMRPGVFKLFDGDVPRTRAVSSSVRAFTVTSHFFSRVSIVTVVPRRYGFCRVPGDHHCCAPDHCTHSNVPLPDVTEAPSVEHGKPDPTLFVGDVVLGLAGVAGVAVGPGLAGAFVTVVFDFGLGFFFVFAEAVLVCDPINIATTVRPIRSFGVFIR